MPPLRASLLSLLRLRQGPRGGRPANARLRPLCRGPSLRQPLARAKTTVLDARGASAPVTRQMRNH
eukprot:10334512-Lingulodinium_polyedra.AAC.1